MLGLSFVSKAQSLSWVVPVEGDLPSREIGMIIGNDSSIRIAKTLQPFDAGSQILRYDVEGTLLEQLSMPRIVKMRHHPLGYIIAGNFGDSLTLGNETVYSGACPVAFYVAMLDDSDQPVWVRNGLSLTQNPAHVVDVAVSGTGRTAVLLRSVPRMIVDGDTLASPHDYDWMLLVFGSDGHLESHQVLTTDGEQAVLVFDRTFIAFDQVEHLWLAGTMENNVVVGSDTIASHGPFQFDHLVARFDSTGALSAHTVIEGGMNGSDAIISYGLAEAIGNGMIWHGEYRDGALVGGVPLDSTGAQSNALIMLLDENLQPSWTTTFGSPGSEWVHEVVADTSINGYRFLARADGGCVVGTDTMPDDLVEFALIGALHEDGGVQEANFFAGTPSWDSNELYMFDMVISDGGTCFVLGLTIGTSQFTNGASLSATQFLARFEPGVVQSIVSQGAVAPSPRVFPSPSEGHLTLKFGSPMNGPQTITVHDSRGTLVYQETIALIAGTEYLDLSSLPSGLYVIRGISRTASFSQKVILE